MAAGSLDANLDEVGYRSHCHRWGYRFFYGAMESIDRAAREIVIAPLIDEDGRELIGRHRTRYDYLVLAIGSITNDFGTPGVTQNCLFLDDRAQADRFRNKLLNHCLRVSRALSENPQADAYVRIAIVGAGATGVELAAELYNAASALRYYGLEVFDESRLQVTLIEAGARILPALPERLADAAREELEALGVRVLTGTRVTSVTPEWILTESRRVDRGRPEGMGGRRARCRQSRQHRRAGDHAPRASWSCARRCRPRATSASSRWAIAATACCPARPPGAAARAGRASDGGHRVPQSRSADAGQAACEPIAYIDRGSLVSLSRYSTVGSLMGNLVGGRMAIEGRLARFVYMSLYRMHLLAIHGWLRGTALILIGHVARILRPRLKLH